MATDDLDQEPDDPGRLRGMYEEAAARAAASEARAVELERREAFRDAGLDPSNLLHQQVMKAYDGPFESEAVKTHVASLGLAEPPAPTEPPPAPTPQTEQDALVRIAQAAMGEGAPAPQPDEREKLRKEMADRAGRHATIAELDELSIRYSQAGGNRTVRDLPGQ